MLTTGKLELTIKINELPQAKTLQNGRESFELDCDGRIVSVSVKPKIWKKLTDAQANFLIAHGVSGAIAAEYPGFREEIKGGSCSPTEVSAVFWGMEMSCQALLKLILIAFGGSEAIELPKILPSETLGRLITCISTETICVC
jgi:hypothetical protein